MRHPTLKPGANQLHVRCIACPAHVAMAEMSPPMNGMMVVTMVVTMEVRVVAVFLPWSVCLCMAWLHADPQHWARVGWKLGVRCLVGVVALLQQVSIAHGPRRWTRIRRWKTCATLEWWRL